MVKYVIYPLKLWIKVHQNGFLVQVLGSPHFSANALSTDPPRPRIHLVPDSSCWLVKYNLQVKDQGGVQHAKWILGPSFFGGSSFLGPTHLSALSASWEPDVKTLNPPHSTICPVGCLKNCPKYFSGGQSTSKICVGVWTTASSNLLECWTISETSHECESSPYFATEERSMFGYVWIVLLTMLIAQEKQMNICVKAFAYSWQVQTS